MLFVVRGYVTGSTDTSLWTVYKKGVRNYCGNALSDGTASFVSIYKLFSSLSTSEKIIDILITILFRIGKKPEASS